MFMRKVTGPCCIRHPEKLDVLGPGKVFFDTDLTLVANGLEERA
jgi:hypothetical protein